jgi:outer membrane lipoprotein-sorting protein
LENQIMIRKALIGTGVALVVVAAAVATDAGHLSTYVSKVNAAEGLDVSYTISEVGGTQAKYRVALAKPNKAMVETPTALYVADGANYTVYDKKRNQYFTKPQSADQYKEIFEADELSVWRAFFDAKVYDKVAATKNEGTRTRRGETLNVVSAQMDARGEYTLRLHLSQKDGLVRQAEFVTADKTKILNVESISASKPADSLFSFTAPAGAKQLTEADMATAEWTTDLNKALEIAAATGKGVMIDFYADW